MNKRIALLVSFILLAILLLTACGGAPAAKPEAPPSYVEPLVQQNADEAAKQLGGAAAQVAPMPTAGSVDNSAQPVDPNIVGGANRLIIKNADVKLLVADSDAAIDRTTQIVGDLGGYIVSSRVWYQDWQDGKSYKYATITIGIPVEQFERALSRLRGLSIKVLDETASGEDVTSQFVDLQSQLTNLQATRERIKGFLEQATTVDEALRINQELSNIEAQIEQIQGQIKYLSDRSAFSTITVNFEPDLPPVATPTPSPTPTPDAWDPGKTFDDAKESVTYAYQGIVDFLIWFFVVLVPIFGPIVLIVWGLWKVLRRKTK
jgi:hypothetical protein